MDKKLVAKITDDIAAALAPVAAKYKMKLTVKGGTFDPHVGLFKPRLELTEADSDERLYRRLAPQFGLKADTFGRTFTHAGREFTITGLNPNASRQPIMARAADGRTFKFTVSGIVAALGTAAQPSWSLDETPAPGVR
jgi:hypothetical protein